MSKGYHHLTTHRFRRIGGLLLGGLVLLFVGISFKTLLETPRVGALWLNSHLVEYASSASMLRVGDRIVNADGTEILGSQLDELLEQASELSNPEVTLYVIRDGFLQPLTMTLFVTRDPWIIFTSTAPVVVALLLWVLVVLKVTTSASKPSLTARAWALEPACDWSIFTSLPVVFL